MKIRQLFLLLNCLIALNTIAQHKRITFSKLTDLSYDGFQQESDSVEHNSFKPLIINRPVMKLYPEDHEPYRKVSKFNKLLFHDHLLELDKEGIYITADPVFNFEAGQDIAAKIGDKDDRTLYKNTRGFNIMGNITPKVGFQSSFSENQGVFPDYLDQYIAMTSVVPGQGRVKNFKNGYDYAMASGSVFYTPVEELTIRFGHDKSFIGEGYRSLMLSDNGFNYPFFRTDLLLFRKKLSYSFMFTSFQDLQRINSSPDTEPLFLRRSGNFHYLSWSVNKQVRVGVMEGTVFNSMDTTGRTTVEANSLNPLIGVSSLSYGLNDEHNSLLGIDLKVKFGRYFSIYMQSVWDNNKLDRPAFQAGMNWLGENNRFRIEYNQVSKGVYEATGNGVGYGHYNQPLAHPAGNNFREILGMALITKDRLFATIKANYIDYNEVLYLPLLVQSSAYQPGADVLVQDLAIGWMINYSSGMNLSAGISHRNNYLNLLDDTSYIYFTFRTSLPASYYDF